MLDFCCCTFAPFLVVVIFGRNRNRIAPSSTCVDLIGWQEMRVYETPTKKSRFCMVHLDEWLSAKVRANKKYHTRPRALFRPVDFM